MKTIILIICICLSGCAGFGGTKVINLDNAKAECRYFGVKGVGLKKIAPKFFVSYHKDIENYCPTNKQGRQARACITESNHIYMKNKDWLALGHEKCHGLFNKSWDIKQHSHFISILDSAKAR
jgi:hypothetical protein